MVRRAVGNFTSYAWSGWSTTGAFTQTFGSSAVNFGGTGDVRDTVFTFDNARVGPTSNTNKPRAWGALACCYLGTPAA